uniref:Uncharacterized protein n=1 Tax=Lepeophtheirus salmonis TaxID=72036 RepID=A0A0K2UR39_LEPSM
MEEIEKRRILLRKKRRRHSSFSESCPLLVGRSGNFYFFAFLGIVPVIIEE